jgi:DNA-binding response OmpR family regulator
MPPSTAEARTPPGRPTVFCIDDDPLVLHFYEDFLTAHGYEVVTATDGLVGIQLARDLHPDVILLDVMLRGLSGYDLCRKCRADPALRAIPIILLTVWDDPSVATTGREAGATLTLRKPADAETILTVIEQVLRERSAPPAT